MAKKRGDFLAEQEARRERTDQEALRLWRRIDQPTDDQPRGPESGFSEDAIAMAKRGRQCAAESVACGSARARRAIRHYERIARKHGGVTMEAERLLEYPHSAHRYTQIFDGMRRIADWGGNGV